MQLVYIVSAKYMCYSITLERTALNGQATSGAGLSARSLLLLER